MPAARYTFPIRQRTHYDSIHLGSYLGGALGISSGGSKPYVDIAFVVPLREEFERLSSAFPVVGDQVKGPLYFATLNPKHDGLKVAAVLQDDMGKAAATRAAEALVELYDIGIIIIIGIAGGISNDVAVGDVCITGSVIDILENIKVSGGKKSIKLEF